MRPRPEVGSEPGWDVIEAAAASARAHLGGGLISAYAIGSLAHGGFRPAVSDVDLALLTDDRSAREMAAALAAISEAVAPMHDGLGARLSVFHVPWTRFADPPPTARFPPIDRFDLVRHGVLVDGPDLRARYATVPGADAIRAQAVDSALARVTVGRVADELRALAAGGASVHDATKAVLWPVRLQHVCDSGEATGNADAVAHYTCLPGARHEALVGDALAWRDLPSLPDPAAVQVRIGSELADLHAEVLGRLGRWASLPRHAELAMRGREIGGVRSARIAR